MSNPTSTELEEQLQSAKTNQGIITMFGIANSLVVVSDIFAGRLGFAFFICVAAVYFLVKASIKCDAKVAELEAKIQKSR